MSITMIESRLRSLDENSGKNVVVMAASIIADSVLRFCHEDCDWASKDYISAAEWALDAARRWACGETDEDEFQASYYAAQESWNEAADPCGDNWIIELILSLYEYAFGDSRYLGDIAACSAAARYKAVNVVTDGTAHSSNRMQALIAYLDLLFPINPALTSYKIWRGKFVCRELLLQMPPECLVQWDHDCEKGLTPEPLLTIAENSGTVRPTGE